MTARPVVIGSPAELGELLAARLRGRRVAVHLPWAGKDRSHLERRLSALVGACGCTTGTIAMATSLAVYAGMVATRGLPGSTSLPVVIGVGLGILVVSAGVGKALGLVGARLMLVWTVRRLSLAGREAAAVE